MAGLISGLAQTDLLGAAARARLRRLLLDDLHALAAYANRAAAIACSRQGANPPTSAELGFPGRLFLCPKGVTMPECHD